MFEEDEDERRGYDPMISGLEPESFDTVFHELFSGCKTYLVDEEPSTPIYEEFPKYLLDENFALETPPPSLQLEDVSSEESEPEINPNTEVEKVSEMKTIPEVRTNTAIKRYPEVKRMSQVQKATGVHRHPETRRTTGVMRHPVTQKISRIHETPKNSGASRISGIDKSTEMEEMPQLERITNLDPCPEVEKIPEVTQRPKLVSAPRNKLLDTRQFAVLRCGYCPRDFVSQFALEYHECRLHKQFFSWYCRYCEIRFDTLQQASDHTLLNHGCGNMPVHHEPRSYLKLTPSVMQALTTRSNNFVKDFLYTRGNETLMTAAYYLFAKRELQAITGNGVGMVAYNEAKTDLLATISIAEFDEFADCLKDHFIYSKFIMRVPFEEYTGPTTIYKTVTFVISPKTVQEKIHDDVRYQTHINRKPYKLVSRNTLAPYGNYQVRSLLRTPGFRSQNYTLNQPLAPQSYVRRSDFMTSSTYPLQCSTNSLPSS